MIFKSKVLSFWHLSNTIGVKMEIISLKITGLVKEKLALYSKRKGISKSEIIRNALNEYFDKDDLDKQGTFLSLASDLAGSADGPADLSTNKDHFSGYGR